MTPFTIILVTLLCALVVWFRRRQCGGAQRSDRAAGDEGWVRNRGAMGSMPNQEKEEWDIREATFLYQTRGLGAEPCYLAANCTFQTKVAGATTAKSAAIPAAPAELFLPDEFMKRIADAGRNVKRNSDCEATARGVVNKHSGELGGSIFTVSDIFWISPTDVEVSGGMCVGATAASVKTYYLKKIDGSWEIVGEHLKSIASRGPTFG